MGLHILAHENAEPVTIEKLTIICRDRKIRMEYYPQHGPLYCPSCGLELPKNKAPRGDRHA